MSLFDRLLCLVLGFHRRPTYIGWFPRGRDLRCARCGRKL